METIPMSEELLRENQEFIRHFTTALTKIKAAGESELHCRLNRHEVKALTQGLQALRDEAARAQQTIAGLAHQVSAMHGGGASASVAESD